MSLDHAGAATFRPARFGSELLADEQERRHAAGYAAGWAAGARAAAERAATQDRLRAEEYARNEEGRDGAIADALATLDQVATAVSVRDAPARAEITAAVYRAAIELAEAVLEHELQPGPGSARSILERASALPADAGLHTIRVSPRDLEHVRAVLDQHELGLPPGVALVPDPGLKVGDVVSEHAFVVLDGQIRAALDRARIALDEQS